jgi:hypothetical protein
MCGAKLFQPAAGIVTTGRLWSPPRMQRPQQPGPVSIPLRILNLFIVLCGLAICMALLFGFVAFMNSWMRWHRYENAACHRSSFQVTHAYLQKRKSRSNPIDVYASGNVEDHQEWIDLQPYLHSVPQDETELRERVPLGTTIDIYYFPGLKGRARVQVYNPVPPAEQGRHAAMTALNNGLTDLAIAAAIMFLLIYIRRIGFKQNLPATALSSDLNPN